MYSSRLKNDSKILKILLERAKETRYGRPKSRLVGYGGNHSFFEDKDIPKEDRVSRGTFGNRKSSLLESKLIAILPTKSKRIFSITPLGIIFLFNENLVKPDFQLVDRVIKITYFHSWLRILHKHRTNIHSRIDPELFYHFLEKLPKDIVIQCVTDGLKNIRVEISNKDVFIYYLESLPNTPFLINEMYSIVDSKFYKVSNFKERFSLKDSTPLTDGEFYRAIGDLIYRSIHQEIYWKLKRKKIPEFYKNEILGSVESHLLNWEYKVIEIKKILDEEWKEFDYEPLKPLVSLLTKIDRQKIMERIKK